MPHATNLIMHDLDMIATARPLFSDDIALVEKDDRVCSAAITLCPLPEPECNWRISFQEGASIGHNAITCAMQAILQIGTQL